MRPDTVGEAPTFASYATFYHDRYGHALREARTAGACGAMMLVSDQEAGDWSDAPVPDLVIGRHASRPVSARFDLGAGGFYGAVRRDDFVVIAPRAGASIVVDAPHVCEVLALPYAALGEMLGDDASLPGDGDFGVLHGALQNDRTVGALIDRWWHEARSDNLHGALFADGTALHLIAALLRLRDGASTTVRGGLAPWQVRRTVDQLTARLADDVTMHELAASVRLSPWHFARAFKQSTGTPPHLFHRRLRVDRAKALLESSDQSVTDIALSVGYESSQSFAKLFRREAGCTPSQWRRTHRH